MVTDNISNAAMYYGLSERIRKGLAFLKETDFENLEPGRYEIDGSNIYALVQKYETKPLSEGKWEAHRKYIDIQYVFAGVEQMGYAFAENLQVTREYDPDNDYLLLQGNGNMLLCNSGTFAIFFPDDAHMPCLAANDPIPVKKVVVKIRA